MKYLLIILATGVFGSMVSIMYFKRIIGRKTSDRFRQITLLMLFVEITILSLLGNTETSLYSRINLLGLFTTVAAFFVTMNYIIKNKTKEIYISAGALTVFYLISIINAAVNGYWNEVLNFYGLCYGMNLYIYIIVFIVKRNKMALLAGKILAGVYAFNVIIRAIVNYDDVFTFIVEIIFFGVVGAIFATPLMIAISKRMPNNLPRLKLVIEKNNMPENAGNKNKTTETVVEDKGMELDNIVD